MVSVATDGTGKMRSESGGTYPDYSLVEDATAEAFGGKAVKAKDVFDVLLPHESDRRVVYGVSCKMKNNDIARLRQARVYIEYANADSEFLGAVRDAGFTKQDLIDHRAPADVCGKAVVEVARGWHARAGRVHKGLGPGQRVDIERSVHFVLSYRWSGGDSPGFEYDLYVYPHLIPQVDHWRYGPSSLWGFESAELMTQNEPLYTYNFNSGGHLKWFPRASTATYHLGPLALRQAPKVTLQERAKGYFPTEWPD